MKIRLIYLSICFVVLVGCSGDKPKIDLAEENSTNQEKIITARAIENFDYKDYVLSTDAEKAVANWEKYQELAIQINYLKKADLSFFIGDKDLLVKFIEAFKLGLPENFKTNPIVSRMAVVETSLLRLNENLTIDNIGGNIKLESVKEVLVAFSNLNYQINKKLERDKYEKIKSQY